MKVYLVIHDDSFVHEQDTGVYGIASTEEIAKEKVKELSLNSHLSFDYVEVEIDNFDEQIL